MLACPTCTFPNEDDARLCLKCGGGMDQSAARELIGQVLLGHYVVVDVLGQGGMSVVYKARHRLTEQVVALKVLPPELAIHSTLKSRFLEEARALARLEHPTIVRLYAFGEDGGRFVLAMQYVEGETLERLIVRATRLPWREVARIGLAVLDALEAAHAQGVIHRDIKPSNVLIRPDGQVIVMDFGIAKMSGASTAGRLTETGQTMGTVRYMAPEQVRGEGADHRSDLYALGVTLWEALDGESPFEGATHFEIMSKQLTDVARPLAEDGVEVPPALEDWLRRSMAKAATERFQSPAEARDALRLILGDDASDEPGAGGAQAPRAWERARTAPPTGWPTHGPEETTAVVDAPRRARLAIGAGIAVVLAGAALAWTFVGPGAGGPGVPTPARQRALAAPTTPEPLLVQGLLPSLDVIVPGDVPLRILAARQLDVTAVARAYAGARDRFVTYLEAHGIHEVAPPVPVNLVIAPAGVMCAPELYPDGPPPGGCGQQPYRFVSTRRTLYVLDGPALETESVLQGASFVACISDEVLLERGCLRRENLLGGFWKEALPARAPVPAPVPPRGR